VRTPDINEVITVGKLNRAAGKGICRQASDRGRVSRLTVIPNAAQPSLAALQAGSLRYEMRPFVHYRWRRLAVCFAVDRQPL
jgi:hypothetical protein